MERNDDTSDKTMKSPKSDTNNGHKMTGDGSSSEDNGNI